MLYKGHSVFLTWITTPPGIYLPCLTGHLTLLSLRLCCHGNSSVAGPGWAWGMSCGEMARILQQRERGGGKWQRRDVNSEAEMFDGKLRGLWHGRGGARVFTPSLLQGMLSLCFLADLKSAIPSFCAKSRSCLVNSSLYRILTLV